MHEKNLPSCGKSRFGCWVCTMVEKDKSMEAMIANDEEKAWMTPLLEFRNEFGDIEGDRERRSFRRMNGKLQGSYGQLYHGPYKKEVREGWLRKLLTIQKEIHDTAPDEYKDYELITIEEMREIRRIWVFEKHEFDDALPEIYREVTGKIFYDPTWIRSETFGKEEWDVLQEVCKDLYPEEELSFEMMYTLIDMENRANNMNQRKGLLDSLENCVRNTFYKDEIDATEYYSKRMTRKKDYGGKYDQKFLDLLSESAAEITNSSNDEEVDA